MNNNNKIIIGIVVAIIIVGGGALIYSMNKSSDTTTAPVTEFNNMIDDSHMDMGTSSSATASTSSSVSVDAGVTVEGVKEFTLTGNNFSFSPKTMTVNKGDKVKITFINSQGFHDFKIDEFNVATKQIAAGKQEVVEFTADKAGSFEYYCSVGNHRAMGMKGTLTVK